MKQLELLWSRLQVQAELWEDPSPWQPDLSGVHHRLTEALRHKAWDDVLTALETLKVVVLDTAEGLTFEGSSLPESIQDGLRGQRQGLLLALCGRAQRRDATGRTLLHQAWRLDAARSAQLLASGALVGAQDRLGRTPLHEAVGHQKADVVHQLVAAGAPLARVDHSRRTPLHLASEQGRPDIVEALLQSPNAPLNPADNLSRTPLHVAAANGRAAAVKALVLAGATVDVWCRDRKTPLVLALERGDDATVRALLDGHADPQAHGLVPSPLRRTLAAGRARLAWRLLSYGAHIDDLAFEILTVSVEKHDAALLTVALERGIDPGLDDGRFMVLAVSLDDLLSVKVLLKGGAPPAPQDNLPLKLAIYRGHRQIAAALKTAGAPIEPPQQMYETRVDDRSCRFLLDLSSETIVRSEVRTEEGWVLSD